MMPCPIRVHGALSSLHDALTDTGIMSGYRARGWYRFGIVSGLNYTNTALPWRKAGLLKYLDD